MCVRSGVARAHVPGHSPRRCSADGDSGSGEKIPGGSTLQFEVELLDIKEKGKKKKKPKKKKKAKAKEEM